MLGGLRASSPSMPGMEPPRPPAEVTDRSGGESGSSQTPGSQPPKQQRFPNRLDAQCQNGNASPIVWKPGAKTAMLPQTFGCPVPKRQRFPKRLDARFQNGNASPNVWMPAAKTATLPQSLGCPVPKWRWPIFPKNHPFGHFPAFSAPVGPKTPVSRTFFTFFPKKACSTAGLFAILTQSWPGRSDRSGIFHGFVSILCVSLFHPHPAFPDYGPLWICFFR
jgi:hypothetical protein